jgi:cystathionine beta-lyase
MADKAPPIPQAESTRLVHAVGSPGELARTVNPPVQRGSTVLVSKAARLYDYSKPTYGRQGLAAQRGLQEALDTLEGAAGTCLYPSGLAAVTGALLALLKAGDEILVADCAYAPTRRFCNQLLARYGVAVRYFDPLAPAEAILQAASPATRLILLESPGSLTFEVMDVPGVARLARERGILTAIDNTFAAGVLFKPLAHGVDVSIQALTKYVGGHSDVFMGSASARDTKVLQRLREGELHIGWAVSPDDAYQMLRGLRTLTTRLQRHGASAVAVAEWLRGQDEVAEVLCPALPGARGHALFQRDFTATNGLFGLVLQPAPEAAVLAFLDALDLFGLGFSWGGFESLAIHCDPQLAARTTPVDFAGPLVRLHIGLEDVADLTADLRRGLDAFAAARAN